MSYEAGYDLKPMLFFLALDTAKPAGGYAAAQWSNGAGPVHTNTQTHTQHTSQSVFISPNPETEWDMVLMCG